MLGFWLEQRVHRGVAIDDAFTRNKHDEHDDDHQH